MTVGRSPALLDGARAIFLGVGALGLITAMGMALLALIDSSDFIWGLWLWWLALPFMIAALIVCSALLSRRAKPKAALLIALVSALPGFAAIWFAAAVALQ